MRPALGTPRDDRRIPRAALEREPQRPFVLFKTFIDGAPVASKKREKRRNVSFKDVQIAYLMSGVSAIEALVTRGAVSKPTLRRTLSELAASGRNVEPLQRWVDEHLGVGAPGGGRGRSPAGAGDTRSYKAQQVKSGGPFLRLPLDVLGVKKGGALHVRFERDSIVITR